MLIGSLIVCVTSGGFHDHALDKNTDSVGFPQCDEQLSGEGIFWKG